MTLWRPSQRQAALDPRPDGETTLRRIETQPRRLDDYEEIAPDELLKEARTLAGELADARLLQVNATASGDGVAELLASEVGLMRGLGIDVEWRLICPDAELFRVTRHIHHAMQGQGTLSRSEIARYLSHAKHCGAMLDDGWDIVVIHDPQPAALIASQAAPEAQWVWRCHIDTSAPSEETWELLRPFVWSYDAAVFSLADFVPPGLASDRIEQIAPAIDPFTARNRPLPRELSQSIVIGAGIDPARPLVLQVARFDAWKDPVDVIAAWRLAREQVPGLQLALVSAMADDDPAEGFAVYEQAREASSGETDCHLLTNLHGVGPLEVNAFQREADVVIQQSLREGFGLTVSEALWKQTPVVGCNAAGIPMQLSDDAGILVSSIEACAGAIVNLLEDHDFAAQLAESGHERVRREFLMPRLVRDDLRLYASLLRPAQAEAQPGEAAALV